MGLGPADGGSSPPQSNPSAPDHCMPGQAAVTILASIRTTQRRSGQSVIDANPTAAFPERHRGQARCGGEEAGWQCGRVGGMVGARVLGNADHRRSAADGACRAGDGGRRPGRGVACQGGCGAAVFRRRN